MKMIETMKCFVAALERLGERITQLEKAQTLIMKAIMNEKVNKVNTIKLSQDQTIELMLTSKTKIKIDNIVYEIRLSQHNTR